MNLRFNFLLLEVWVTVGANGNRRCVGKEVDGVVGLARRGK